MPIAPRDARADLRALLSERDVLGEKMRALTKRIHAARVALKRAEARAAKSPADEIEKFFG